MKNISPLCQKMINIDHSTFLLPTKAFRRLTILLAIHNASSVSQHKIAQATSLSSSMVNSYIKELTAARLIQISNRNNRDYNYRLTPKGRNKLTSLLMEYSAEIVQFYAQTKNELSKRISAILNGSRETKIVLFGASETCELVMRALDNFPQASVVGIVDSVAEKQGGNFHGFTVRRPEDIPQIHPDCVLITSYAKQDEIYKATRHLEKDGIMIQRLTKV